MEKVAAIGLDTSKSVFHLHGVNHNGREVFRRKLARKELLSTISDLPQGCLIYLEAGSASHYWGREFTKKGVRPKIIAAQKVKPFVSNQKNDYRDAEAICEAGQRPAMTFVPLKTTEQQELQAIHCFRERLVRHRTAAVNQLRGFLAEHGVVLREGVNAVRRYLESSFNEDPTLPNGLKQLIQDCKEELLGLDQRIKAKEDLLKEYAKQSVVVQRLQTIPGIGILTATALVTVSGNLSQFNNGREFAAFLGLVPRQNSSGGKTRLMGITKRGDGYIRKLLVQGGMSNIRRAPGKTDPYNLWVNKLCATKGRKITAVAIANKNARIAWSVMTSNAEFDSSKLLRAVEA